MQFDCVSWRIILILTVYRWSSDVRSDLPRKKITRFSLEDQLGSMSKGWTFTCSILWRKTTTSWRSWTNNADLRAASPSFFLVFQFAPLWPKSGEFVSWCWCKIGRVWTFYGPVLWTFLVEKSTSNHAMSWESLWRNACCYGMKVELCEYLLQNQVSKIPFVSIQQLGHLSVLCRTLASSKIKKTKLVILNPFPQIQQLPTRDCPDFQPRWPGW